MSVAVTRYFKKLGFWKSYFLLALLVYFLRLILDFCNYMEYSASWFDDTNTWFYPAAYNKSVATSGDGFIVFGTSEDGTTKKSIGIGPNPAKEIQFHPLIGPERRKRAAKVTVDGYPVFEGEAGFIYILINGNVYKCPLDLSSREAWKAKDLGLLEFDDKNAKNKN